MTFILDTSTLGGLDSAVTKTVCQDVGQGLTLDWQQKGFDQDLELYGFSVELAPSESVAYDAQTTLAQVLTAYGTGPYGAGPYGGVNGSNTGIFILDVSTLGTLIPSINDMPIQDRGRTIQITWSQSGFDQDIELQGYALRFAPAESEMAPDTT